VRIPTIPTAGGAVSSDVERAALAPGAQRPVPGQSLNARRVLGAVGEVSAGIAARQADRSNRRIASKAVVDLSALADKTWYRPLDGEEVPLSDLEGERYAEVGQTAMQLYQEGHAEVLGGLSEVQRELVQRESAAIALGFGRRVSTRMEEVEGRMELAQYQQSKVVHQGRAIDAAKDISINPDGTINDAPVENTLDIFKATVGAHLASNFDRIAGNEEDGLMWERSQIEPVERKVRADVLRSLIDGGRLAEAELYAEEYRLSMGAGVFEQERERIAAKQLIITKADMAAGVASEVPYVSGSKERREAVYTGGGLPVMTPSQVLSARLAKVDQGVRDGVIDADSARDVKGMIRQDFADQVARATERQNEILGDWNRDLIGTEVTDIKALQTDSRWDQLSEEHQGILEETMLLNAGVLRERDFYSTEVAATRWAMKSPREFAEFPLASIEAALGGLGSDQYKRLERLQRETRGDLSQSKLFRNKELVEKFIEANVALFENENDALSFMIEMTTFVDDATDSEELAGFMTHLTRDVITGQGGLTPDTKQLRHITYGDIPESEIPGVIGSLVGDGLISPSDASAYRSGAASAREMAELKGLIVDRWAETREDAPDTTIVDDALGASAAAVSMGARAAGESFIARALRERVGDTMEFLGFGEKAERGQVRRYAIKHGMNLSTEADWAAARRAWTERMGEGDTNPSNMLGSIGL